MDGRNRYLACRAALVDPHFRVLPAGLDEFAVASHIVSTNVARRHLNPGQLAAVASKVKTHFAELAKQRQAEAAARDRTLPKPSHSDAEVVADRRQPPERERKATEQAAKAVGAAGRNVQKYESVARHAPDLADQGADREPGTGPR